MRFNSIVQDMSPTRLLIEMGAADPPTPDRAIRQRAGRLYSEIDGTLDQRNGPPKDLLTSSEQKDDALNAQSFEDGGGGACIVMKPMSNPRFQRLGSFQN